MILNCNGKVLSFDCPKVMGIINVNNDSFYANSRVTNLIDIEAKASTMIEDGASIIDIGAMSSKPGSSIVSHEEEWSILAPVIKKLSTLNTIISVDTVWSTTAQKAIDTGAHIINDISAGTFDSQMMKTVADIKNVPYIIMHMVGTPMTMQQHTYYENIIVEMLAYFSRKISEAYHLGIKDIVIDPGFGFSKTLDQNYTLLNHLRAFGIYDVPIMVGLSRKSMLYKLFGTSADEALNATTAANTIALMLGANILRVHDVKQAVESVKIYGKFKSG